MSASADQLSMKARRWTLAIASIATFMLMLDVTVVNIALPQLRTSLGATFTDLQWVLNAYTLTLAVFLLTGGSLADRLGRKRVFGSGLVIFILASLAAGAAQNMLMLNIARGIQGVGGAILFAVAPALIGHEFRGKDRGMAFGIFGSIVGLALAFGPLIGGVLTDVLSWRWIFLVNVPIGVLVLTASVLRLRESRDDKQSGIDWPGMLIFTTALTLLVIGFQYGESQDWTSPEILSSFIGGAVLLVVFVVIEHQRGDGAMLDLSLFQNTTFKGISAATLLSNATSLAAIFLVVSYLQNILGYSPLQAGIRLMPLTLILFIVAALTGNLMNNISPGKLVGVSISFIAVGMGLITLVNPDSSWTALLPSMVVMGIGMGIFNPPRAAVSIGVAEPAKAGMAAGVGETFQQIGVVIGIAAFGALFQHRVLEAFTSSSVGIQLGAQTEQFGRATAAGAGAELSRTLPPALAAQVAETARSTFVNGLADVMAICSLVCGLGALIAFSFIRRRDLHESALAPAQSPIDEGTSFPAPSEPGSYPRVP